MISFSNKKDRTECGYYRDISHVSPTGRIFLKIVATRLYTYSESKERCQRSPVWISPAMLDHRHDVCGAQAGRARKESARTAVVSVFYQYSGGVRLCRPHTSFFGRISPASECRHR